MLPLVRTDEIVDLVFSFDESVQVEAEPFRALPREAVELHGEATTVGVRALSGTEALRVLGDGSEAHHEVVIKAAHLAVSRVATGGEEAHTGEQARSLLDRLPPVAISAVGAWVLEQSLDVADPFVDSASAPSSGETSCATPTGSTASPATGNGATSAAAVTSASTGIAAR